MSARSKHPSVRRRRNVAPALWALASGERSVAPPAWPLAPDAALSVRAETFEDKVAALQAALEAADDGRARGRLRRQVDRAELVAALARAQLAAQTAAEADLWESLWRTPQSRIWETSDAFGRMLAQFVRWNVKAESGDLDAAREARLRGKEFGLTPLTLMGLKAEIERADEAEAKGNRRRTGGTGRPDDGAAAEPDPRAGLYVIETPAESTEKGGA